MPQYMLVLDAHAMDHVPDEDMPNVDRAAHAVRQEEPSARRSFWQSSRSQPGSRCSVAPPASASLGFHRHSTAGHPSLPEPDQPRT